MLKDRRLPWVHGREGADPEELMKYVCRYRRRVKKGNLVNLS